MSVYSFFQTICFIAAFIVALLYAFIVYPLLLLGELIKIDGFQMIF